MAMLVYRRVPGKHRKVPYMFLATCGWFGRRHVPSMDQLKHPLPALDVSVPPIVMEVKNRPWKMNGWNLKITCLKREIIFQTFIFGFLFSFLGSMLIFRGAGPLVKSTHFPLNHDSERKSMLLWDKKVPLKLIFLLLYDALGTHSLPTASQWF